MYLHALSVVVMMVVSSTAAYQCNFPPSLWCSSRRIARVCEVEKQCKSYLSTKKTSDAPKVNFTLYYESLCGGCRDFIKTQYYTAFKAIGSILNVNLVPYGNAMEIQHGNEWDYTCQHGEEECIGNLIETCAIHLHPNASVFFPFIHCIETSSSYPRQAAPSCAEKFRLDYTTIKQCANGALGNSLEHEMALKTGALNPPHQFVPWVTLNGVHTDDIQDQAESNLVALICASYKGSPKPEACEEKLNFRRCLKKKNQNQESKIIIND